ncbi:MAG: glycosyltransferase [Terrimicrobiaceae bacterium]|nr:glycosyltransferase [Terrimicrobiaceae bacterium]
MKLVLAHDYLVQMGGAERVVATMHEAYPEAPIFTSAIAPARLWETFADADIRTSWMQNLPGMTHHTHFKKYFPLYPFAFRSFPPVECDVAWISCSSFAKFLRFAPGGRTVCYLHNTTRFLWQTDEYLRHEVGNPVLNGVVRTILPMLREIEKRATRGFTVLLVNSKNVQQRVKRFYGLDADVVHPPVETSRFHLSTENEGYYLIVSRLLGYKNIELPVRLFSRTGRPLVVVGEGPDLARLKSLAGPNVRFIGRSADDALRLLYGRCRALILPGEEDFGITPVEAMACGKPVVAFGRGGALESVQDGITGVFFSEDSENGLEEAIARSESVRWEPEAIRRHALGFSREVFLEKTRGYLGVQ